MRVLVCQLSQLTQGVPFKAEADGQPLLLLKHKGTVYAVSDRCTHADASLSKGSVSGCVVQCPLHGARFDVSTGRALSLPAVAPLETFEVHVAGGDVLVELD